MTDDSFRVDPTLPLNVKRSDRINYGGGGKGGGGGHHEPEEKRKEPETREITEVERTEVELALEDANKLLEKNGRSMRLHIIHKDKGEVLMIENTKTGEVVNAESLGLFEGVSAKNLHDFIDHLESGKGIIFELDA